MLLERHGFRLATARVRRGLSPGAAGPIDVILLDLNFARGATSGAEGFEWLAEIRAHDPDAVVVVVTGHSGINIAVAAMKAGACDFVMKPWNNPRFLETLRAAVALRRSRIGGQAAPALDDDLLIVGDSAAMKRVRDLVNGADRAPVRSMKAGPAGLTPACPRPPGRAGALAVSTSAAWRRRRRGRGPRRRRGAGRHARRSPRCGSAQARLLGLPTPALTCGSCPPRNVPRAWAACDDLRRGNTVRSSCPAESAETTRRCS